MWRKHCIRSFSWVYAVATSVVVSSFHVSETRKSRHLPHGSPSPIFGARKMMGGGLAVWNDRHVTRCEAVRHPSIEKDYELMVISRSLAEGHAIFGTLLGEGMIERYDVYKRPKGSTNPNVVVAHVKLGNQIDGHPGVVHGGILALILDDFLGFGFEALGAKMAVTANLNIDYRAPVFAGTEARIQAQLDRQEGRKLYWKVQMTDMNGETLYAECTSLYIIPRAYATE